MIWSDFIPFRLIAIACERQKAAGGLCPLCINWVTACVGETRQPSVSAWPHCRFLPAIVIMISYATGARPLHGPAPGCRCETCYCDCGQHVGPLLPSDGTAWGASDACLPILPANGPIAHRFRVGPWILFLSVSSLRHRQPVLQIHLPKEAHAIRDEWPRTCSPALESRPGRAVAAPRRAHPRRRAVTAGGGDALRHARKHSLGGA